MRMGTAGLNVSQLAGLLERLKIDCDIVDGDAAFDHCLLRLTSVRQPAVVALLEYENQGVEPRLAGLAFRGEAFMPQRDDYPLKWEYRLELRGAREADAEKIARWVEREYLDRAI